MTNKSMLSVELRALLERVAAEANYMLGFTSASNYDECRKAVDELRALLDKPTKLDLIECDACPTSGGCVSVCMKAPKPAAQHQCEPVAWVHPAYLVRREGMAPLAIDATLNQIAHAQIPLYAEQPAPVVIDDERAAYEQWQWRRDWPIEQLAGARRSEYFKRKFLDPKKYESERFNAGLAVWLARATIPVQPAPVELTVWYGSMPESNGKTNWTAILHRKGGEGSLIGALSGGITIDRSEYPDRVRYEADRMRYLIGELADEPFILDYDADKHSGYVKPEQSAPVSVVSP